MITRASSLVVAVFLFAPVLVLCQAKPSVQGVWRVAEVTTTGPNASTSKPSQPGFYIFTAKHFAIVRDVSSTVRPEVKDPSKPTPAEGMATYVPFQARAGTYEVTGNMIHYVVAVAKNPPHGRKEADTFKIDGDSLWITQVDGGRGKVANPETLRLVRVE